MSTTVENVKKYSPSFLTNLLEQMLLIRRFEEKCAQSYGLKKICGFLHLYIGQEAVAVGSIAALDLKKDYVLTTYRDHAQSIACGTDVNSLMAELYGKATGCSRGKGGSMHFFDAKNHMLGGNGIVGAHLPIAAGVALKIRYLREEGVVLCYFGDGAIHQGAFHETLNMCKLWNLPVIFICENNQYGMGTDFRRVSSLHDFSKFGDSYGITGKQINGMDVLEVYEEIKAAATIAKKEYLPFLFEIKTYRYRGHSMSDPAKYRTREELENYKKADPIYILKDAMIAAGIYSEDQYLTLDEKCKVLSDEAEQFAEQSPEPLIETIYEDIIV